MKEFSDLFNPEEINEVLEQQRDPDRKEIGDRVHIKDFSSCTHINGMELDWEDEDEKKFGFMSTFMVVEINQNHIHDAYYKQYKQDIVIVNLLTKKYYRINSGHVKLK